MQTIARDLDELAAWIERTERSDPQLEFAIFRMLDTDYQNFWRRDAMRRAISEATGAIPGDPTWFGPLPYRKVKEDAIRRFTLAGMQECPHVTSELKAGRWLFEKLFPNGVIRNIGQSTVCGEGGKILYWRWHAYLMPDRERADQMAAGAGRTPELALLSAIVAAVKDPQWPPREKEPLPVLEVETYEAASAHFYGAEWDSLHDGMGNTAVRPIFHRDGPFAVIFGEDRIEEGQMAVLLRDQMNARHKASPYHDRKTDLLENIAANLRGLVDSLSGPKGETIKRDLAYLRVFDQWVSEDQEAERQKQADERETMIRGLENLHRIFAEAKRDG